MECSKESHTAGKIKDGNIMVFNVYDPFSFLAPLMLVNIILLVTLTNTISFSSFP